MFTSLSGSEWRKSSYSGGGNDCVEVAYTATAVGVRDSKNPAAGTLVFTENQWHGFLTGVRDGRWHGQ
ncbi:DUF397 domain-containing protein [Allokutzneria oryzae]|uniref:DUF397 domain-containing protein n=1 Tax=Allokutzneria oryzae TaxID=1378989 RepID=A0ABV6A4D6_9PSEU